MLVSDWSEALSSERHSQPRYFGDAEWLFSCTKGVLELNRSLDRNSLGYSRFVTHLRFLLNRIAHPDMVQEPENNRLFQVMYEEASPVAREIVESISLYVEESFGQPIGDAERGYLLLHVHTFVDASK